LGSLLTKNLTERFGFLVKKNKWGEQGLPYPIIVPQENRSTRVDMADCKSFEFTK
jgi:hypothetical protein